MHALALHFICSLDAHWSDPCDPWEITYKLPCITGYNRRLTDVSGAQLRVMGGDQETPPIPDDFLQSEIALMQSIAPHFLCSYDAH